MAWSSEFGPARRFARWRRGTMPFAWAQSAILFVLRAAGDCVEAWLATTGERGENSFNAKVAKVAKVAKEILNMESVVRIDGANVNGANEVSEEVNDSSRIVLDAAMKVHSALGPGLLEGAYEACLAFELRSRGLHVRTQVPIALHYGGLQIDLAAYRADLLVEHAVLVELKSVPKVLPVHEAQLLSYLKMGNFRIGLLINFSAPRLKEGIRRKVNNF